MGVRGGGARRGAGGAGMMTRTRAERAADAAFSEAHFAPDGRRHMKHYARHRGDGALAAVLSARGLSYGDYRAARGRPRWELEAAWSAAMREAAEASRSGRLPLYATFEQALPRHATVTRILSGAAGGRLTFTPE